MPMRSTPIGTETGSMLWRSGIYQTAAGTLFVPTEGMMLIHAASSPCSVLKRAGHAHGLWTFRWKEVAAQVWPDFVNWLYDWRLRRPPPNGVAPTKAMQDFRRESSIGAILRAARRLAQGASGHRNLHR